MHGSEVGVNLLMGGVNHWMQLGTSLPDPHSTPAMEDSSRLAQWMAAEACIKSILIHVEQYLLTLMALLIRNNPDLMEHTEVAHHFLRVYLGNMLVSVLYTHHSFD
jgi:hypothetical protein